MSVEDYFNFGPIPRFITRTLEEDERYRIVTGWRGLARYVGDCVVLSRTGLADAYSNFANSRSLVAHISLSYTNTFLTRPSIS